jgi:hypothetical protein
MTLPARGIVRRATAVALLALACSSAATAAHAETCEADIMCVDPAHVAFGTWPACGCRDAGAAATPPGSAGVQGATICSSARRPS